MAKKKKTAAKPVKKVASPKKPAAKAKAPPALRRAQPVTKSKSVAQSAPLKKSEPKGHKKPPPAPSSASLAGATVEDYISKVAPWQRAIIEKLRVVLRTAAPNAHESIKWGQPVYEHKGPFSYIKAHAAQVNFGFWRGAELDDPKHMLQGEGERMRHVKLVETHVIDEDALSGFVRQAVTLNDKKGDPTKG